MRRQHTIILAAVATLALAALLIWGFIAGRSDAADDTASDESAPAVQVSQNTFGPPTLTLSPELQQAAGIEVRQAQTSPYQQQIDAYGSVLELQSFTDLSNAVASAKAQRAIAEAKAAASRAAFERATLLYKNNQNFSRAELQAAAATYRSDAASVRAAGVQAQNATASAIEAWGPVLGRALAANAPLAQDLIDHKKVLIQVTLPLGVSPPSDRGQAVIEIPTGKRVRIDFVSAAIRTDPQIQGASFFYTADAASGVLPGMNVTVLLSAGRSASGIAIPATAVVWLQGGAWVYLRTGANAFTRHEISTAQPQPGGGYVVPAVARSAAAPASATPEAATRSGVPPNAMLVVAGAQALLSQEFRAQINTGDD